MDKTAMKAANNVYYLARSEAAEFNNRLLSRDGASAELGIDKSRLTRIELGSTNPYPEEVLIMSDVYKAPQLMSYYCNHGCAIRCSTCKECSLERFDKTMLDIASALSKVADLQDIILDFAEDGAIDSSEKTLFAVVLNRLGRISKATEQLEIWAMKNITEV